MAHLGRRAWTRALGHPCPHKRHALQVVSCPRCHPAPARYAVYQSRADMPALLSSVVEPAGPRDPPLRDTIVVVGDGATPRTAAMFALRTSWQVVSVVRLPEWLVHGVGLSLHATIGERGRWWAWGVGREA